MAGQSRKWMILAATIWIQAFTGTNFDFSAYSSQLKSVMGISQVQLNYLATASDLGKALGWSSGLALMYLPLPAVMFIAAFTGLVGYGLQWLLVHNLISLPYFLVFLLCLLSGVSICWFNTVCFVLCIKNFPSNRALALSLTISFNGLSPALYSLLASTISFPDDSIYLILNSLLPLFISFAALIPILRQPPLGCPSTEAAHCDPMIFLILNILAVFTGLYILFLNSISFSLFTSRLLFFGVIFLLLAPLGIPAATIFARKWARGSISASFPLHGSGFNLVEVDDLELHKELLGRQDTTAHPITTVCHNKEHGCCDGLVIYKNRLTMLCEEHPAHLLLRRWDFWLYTVTYLCGGTIGLVYSNNIGQIAESLGDSPDTLVTLYSSFSFFGRLLSAAPDFMRGKVYFARTGWLAIALVPTPVAFFLLAASANEANVQAGTALVGLSSGFIFAAAVSITSELFGPNSVGVNHNILITNIPIGSLLYGLLAAMVYDGNIGSSLQPMSSIKDSEMVCMGRQCYWATFVWWGCISILGLASSLLLFLRTRPAYQHFEQNKITAYTNMETT